MPVRNELKPTHPYVSDYQTIFADEFFEYLLHIQQGTPYQSTIQPLDHLPRIPVDLNSRKIILEGTPYEHFLSIQQEHRAEIICFEVDRYYEDVDLMKCTCVIEYMNLGAPRGEAPKFRFYPITAKQTVLSEKGEPKILLAWNIGSEATEFSGQIKFSLLFYQINISQDIEYNNKIIYALRTQPETGIILPSIEPTEDQKDENKAFYESTDYQEIYGILDNIKTQLNLVYWNDV